MVRLEDLSRMDVSGYVEMATRKRWGGSCEGQGSRRVEVLKKKMKKITTATEICREE